MTLAITAARRTSSVLVPALGAAYVGVEVIRQPSHIRLLAAACVGIVAVVGSMQWPQTAIVTLLVTLPYLAFGRRLLLEFTPWKSTDPLLVIGPVVLLVVLVRLVLIEQRPLATDRISKIMLFLLALTFVETVNPRGGGIGAGAPGLLFTAVPLLWFFAGRELATLNAVRAVFGFVVVNACVIAAYGLNQTWRGLPSWDSLWVDQTGYAALHVGSVVRAFGTFSSASEYASFLAVAIVVAVAFALDRRPYFIPVIPLLGIAVFYESSRSIVVTTVVGGAVVIAASTGSVRRATISVAVLLGAASLGLVFSRGALESASTSKNPLVAHQVGGLIHPLNQNQSTLEGHVGMFQSGFLRGVLDPLGHGTGSTNLAGTKYADASEATGSTEIDLSNEFVANGTFGGIAYLAILLLVLIAALRQAVTQRDAVSLSILGMLVVVFGQWLNGGYYALSPTIWFSIGFVVATKSGGVKSLAATRET